MTITRGWRSFFWFPAAYNFMVGVPPMLAPNQAFGLPAPDPFFIFSMQLLGALFSTFGIGYAMVAVGRPCAREILTLGIIGKWGLCILIAAHLTRYSLPAPMVIAACGDFLFVCAFLYFLLKSRPSTAAG
tara:strand:- start:2504 stop:2893 length:390 start_codon:yes stop_codon:yes gene_type:complete